MVYGVNYEYGPAGGPPRADPDETYHLGEEGMQEGDNLFFWMAEYAEDNREIIIPSGRYEADLGGGHYLGTLNNTIIRGEGPTGSVVAEIDESYAEEPWQPTFTVQSGVCEFVNIRVEGVIADDSGAGEMEFAAQGDDSYMYVERVSLPDGGDNGSGGFHVRDDHAGEIMFKDCESNYSHDYGLNASAPGTGDGGTVYVEHSEFRNNYGAGVRLGSTDSYAWRCCVVNDETIDRGDTPPMYGYQFRSNAPVENVRIIDCDVVCEDIAGQPTPINISDNNDSGYEGRIIESRIENNGPMVAVADGPGTYTYNTLDVTGSGNDTVQIAGYGLCIGDSCDPADCSWADHEGGTTEPSEPSEPSLPDEPDDTDPVAWTREQSFYNIPGYLQDSSIDANGEYLAYGGNEGVWVQRYTAGEWSEIAHLDIGNDADAPTGTVRALHYSEDPSDTYNAYLAVGTSDGEIMAYSHDGNTVSLDNEASTSGTVWDVTTSPSSAYIATTSYNDAESVSDVEIYTFPGLNHVETFDENPSTNLSSQQLDWADTDALLLGGADGNVYSWDYDQQQVEFSGPNVLTIEADRIRTLETSPSGEHMVTGHDDEQVIVSRVSDGAEVYTLDQSGDTVRDSAWGATGRFIMYGGNDTDVNVHDAHDGNHRVVLSEADNNVISCEFNNDEQLAGFADLDGVYHLYNVVARTGAPTVIETAGNVWSTSDNVAQTGSLGTLEISTNGISNITDNSARFHAHIDELDQVPEPEVFFRFRETGSGVTPNETTAQTVDSTGSFAQDTTALDPNTDYEVWAVAEAGSITATGSAQTFSTDAGTPMIEDFESGTYDGWRDPGNDAGWDVQSDVQIGRAGEYSLRINGGHGGTDVLDSAPGDGLPNYPGPGEEWEFFFRFEGKDQFRHRVQIYYGHEESMLGPDVPLNCYGLWLMNNRDPGHVRLYTRTDGEWDGDLFEVEVYDDHFRAGEDYRCVIRQGGNVDRDAHSIEIYHDGEYVGGDRVVDTTYSGQGVAIGNPADMDGDIWIDDLRLDTNLG